MMIILSLLKLQNFIRYVSNKVCAPIPHSHHKNNKCVPHFFQEVKFVDWLLAGGYLG